MYALPPGRSLWTSGIPGIDNEATMNCWYATIKSIDDWAWIANVMMLGGGAGVGLEQVHTMPTIAPGNATFQVICDCSHPNISEIETTTFSLDTCGNKDILDVPDSRQGWVTALRHVLQKAYNAEDAYIDVSSIRPRGNALKTFGGTACGPRPLIAMLRNIWSIVRNAAGRKLTTIDALDITTHIGKCIVMGNIRRTAIMCMADANDDAMWHAKQDTDAIASHRYTSNNSINIHSKKQIDSIDWTKLVECNVNYGDPGINNLWLSKQSEPLIEGVNPCGEIPLRDK